MKILDIFFELEIDYDITFYDTVCKIVVTSGSDVDQMLVILFDASDMMNFLMESEDNNEVCIIKIPKNVLMQELPDKIKDRIRNSKSSSLIVSHATTDNENYKGLWVIDNLEFENIGIEDDHFKLRLIHNPDKLTDEEILTKLSQMNITVESICQHTYNKKNETETVFTFEIHTLPNMMNTSNSSVNVLEAFMHYKRAKDYKTITKIPLLDIIPVKIYEKAKDVYPYSIDMHQERVLGNIHNSDANPFNRVIVITHTNGDMICFLPNRCAMELSPTTNPGRSIYDVSLNNYHRVNVFESYALLLEQADLHTPCEIIQNPFRKKRVNYVRLRHIYNQ